VGQIINLLTHFEVVTIFSVAQNELPTYQVRTAIHIVLGKYQTHSASDATGYWCYLSVLQAS